MLSLASSSVSRLFTIPAIDWTVINKRVGLVIDTSRIGSTIAAVLPAYPALLADSLLWKSETFQGLINKSELLCSYSAGAITSFSNLNNKVKQVIDTGADLNEELKSETAAVLQQLSTDTAPLAAAFQTLSGEVLAFLDNNKAIDAQIASNKSKLGSFWQPVGEVITNLEQAAGLVTGEWQAILDDLVNARVSPVDITLPYIESLNIDAAIVCWTNVQSEAAAFPQIVAGQEQYWTNPF